MAKIAKKSDWKKIRKQAKPIIKALGETGATPMNQIRRIVFYCRLAFTQQLLADTVRIKNNDGMLIKEGTRRRTPGGVFFKLAKDRMTEEQREKVFRLQRRRDTLEKVLAKKEAAKR